jgi:hypothetical protein
MQYMNGLKENDFLKKSQLNRIHKALFQEQQSWIPEWKEIRDYINPYLGSFDGDKPNDGKRKDDSLINTVGIDASNTHGAGMQNGVTSPTRLWFRATDPDPEIAQMEEVRYWYDDLTKIMHDAFSRSNFYPESHKFHKERGTFGTASMFVVEDEESDVRYRTFTIGEFAIGVDHTGRIRRFARNIHMTVAALIDMFGRENVPEIVQRCYDQNRLEEVFAVKHLLMANQAAENGKIDKWNKPFIDVYWMDQCKDGDYLDIGGFDSFPVVCSRWETKGADVYGFGPGHYALRNSKSVQVIDEDIHVGVKKQVDPPVQLPAESMSSALNSLPNGVNYYSSGMNDIPIRELYQVKLNLADANALKASKEETIKRHFFVDLFRMLENIDYGNVTRQEIIERVQEKMSLIGPSFSLLQPEYLKPVVDRTFEILYKRGRIPKPPEVLEGRVMKIEYVNIMAQAQQLSGMSAIYEFSDLAIKLGSADPAVMDKWDRDETLDRAGEMLSIPPSLILDDKKVEQIRAAREQRQQMEQNVQMAQIAAQGAHTLGNTPVGQGSALDALIPGLGGGAGQ